VSLTILNRRVALAGVALHFDDRALTAARYVLEAAQIRFDLDVTDRKTVDRKIYPAPPQIQVRWLSVRKRRFATMAGRGGLNPLSGSTAGCGKRCTSKGYRGFESLPHRVFLSRLQLTRTKLSGPRLGLQRTVAIASAGETDILALVDQRILFGWTKPPGRFQSCHLQ
jgi:hypothetical protein